jgi:rod shape determining protein RodA
MLHIWVKFKDFILAKNYEWKKYNLPLIVSVLVLSTISIFTIWILGEGKNEVANYGKQLVGVIIGLVIMAVVSIIDYHFICKFVVVYYFVVTALVAATRFSPLGKNNNKEAYRWIRIGGFDLQTSELCKLMIIIVLAVLFNKFQNKLDSLVPVMLAVVITALPIAFVLMQPDLSSSLVIIFELGMMIFASGVAYKVLLPFVALGAIAAGGIIWDLFQPKSFFFKPYQVGRVLGFLEPEKYPDDAFQQIHSIDSISSGKLYGKFILGGASEVRNYNPVDVTESDFIWSVIGEEYGFIGSVAIVVILFIFIIICLLVAKRAVDYLGRLIAIGIASMFMFQVFANIGVATMILPNTGLPLPFISSGLSSLFTYMMAVGVLLNIGIQPASKALGKGFLIKNSLHDLSELKFDTDIQE